MVDRRVHIFTITSMFLMLAIGIVIGIAMAPGAQKQMAEAGEAGKK